MGFIWLGSFLLLSTNPLETVSALIPANDYELERSVSSHIHGMLLLTAELFGIVVPSGCCSKSSTRMVLILVLVLEFGLCLDCVHLTRASSTRLSTVVSFLVGALFWTAFFISSTSFLRSSLAHYLY